MKNGELRAEGGRGAEGFLPLGTHAHPGSVHGMKNVPGLPLSTLPLGSSLNI